MEGFSKFIPKCHQLQRKVTRSPEDWGISFKVTFTNFFEVFLLYLLKSLKVKTAWTFSHIDFQVEYFFQLLTFF